MRMDKPSLGRIVRFVGDDGNDRAAIIHDLHTHSTVHLTVFGQTGPYVVLEVEYDAAKAPRSWHWPPRV